MSAPDWKQMAEESLKQMPYSERVHQHGPSYRRAYLAGVRIALEHAARVAEEQCTHHCGCVNRICALAEGLDGEGQGNG